MVKTNEPSIKITGDDSERILISLMNDMSALDLLSIPGIYEILSKHLKNRILETWEEEQELEKEFEKT